MVAFRSAGTARRIRRRLESLGEEDGEDWLAEDDLLLALLMQRLKPLADECQVGIADNLAICVEKCWLVTGY